MSLSIAIGTKRFIVIGADTLGTVKDHLIDPGKILSLFESIEGQKIEADKLFNLVMNSSTITATVNQIHGQKLFHLYSNGVLHSSITIVGAAGIYDSNTEEGMSYEQILFEEIRPLIERKKPDDYEELIHIVTDFLGNMLEKDNIYWNKSVFGVHGYSKKESTTFSSAIFCDSEHEDPVRIVAYDTSKINRMGLFTRLGDYSVVERLCLGLDWTLGEKTITKITETIHEESKLYLLKKYFSNDKERFDAQEYRNIFNDLIINIKPQVLQDFSERNYFNFKNISLDNALKTTHFLIKTTIEAQKLLFNTLNTVGYDIHLSIIDENGFRFINPYSFD
jgi:hypothetical protein